MFVGHVGALTDVGVEVVKTRGGSGGVWGDFLDAHTLPLRIKGELPRPLADGLECSNGGIRRIIIVRLAWGFRAFSKQKRRDVPPVNHRFRRHCAAGERDAGGQDVDGSRDGVAATASRDFARPPREHRLAHPPLPRASLPAAKRTRASFASMFIVPCQESRTVIAGKDNERIVVKVELAEGVKDATSAPVHLLDPVAKGPVGRLPGERRAGMEGRVHGGVREVEKEGLVLVHAAEAEGLVSVALHESGLLRFGEQLDHLVIAHQRDDTRGGALGGQLHVVGIGKAKVVVEPLFPRQELRLVAKVPLADASRGVSMFLQPLRDRRLGRIQTMAISRAIDARNRNARPITTGHQLRAGYGTDRCRVETGDLGAFTRHAVQLRRLLQGRAKRPDVAIAHVVNKDDDDVGFCGFEFSSVK